jgi:glycosyltransferase involved in cell wall biosynthesis
MKQPIRVLMLSVDPRVLGGVAEFIETLKPRLKHCVVTQISTGSGPGRRESRVSVLLRVLTVPLRVAWRELTQRYDVVHVNASLTPRSGVRDSLILIALRIVGCRNVLLYIHGWQWNVARQIEKSWFICRLAGLALGGVQRVLVLAPEFRATLIAAGVPPDRIIVTRTMFDGTKIQPSTEQLPARRRVLFMSRIERGKGVFELTEAFSQVVGRYPDVDLVLAGDGSKLPAIKSMVAELGLENRVILPGYVRGDEKARFLASGTLFVLPSYGGEGMPVALLEAMAAGMPVIASKAGGIPHIVREPEHGLVLDDITPESICLALDEMLSNTTRWQQVGKSNRRYAWDYFEAEQVSAGVEAIYRSIAGCG